MRGAGTAAAAEPQGAPGPRDAARRPATPPAGASGSEAGAERGPSNDRQPLPGCASNKARPAQGQQPRQPAEGEPEAARPAGRQVDGPRAPRSTARRKDTTNRAARPPARRRGSGPARAGEPAAANSASPARQPREPGAADTPQSDAATNTGRGEELEGGAEEGGPHLTNDKGGDGTPKAKRRRQWPSAKHKPPATASTSTTPP